MKRIFYFLIIVTTVLFISSCTTTDVPKENNPAPSETIQSIEITEEPAVIEEDEVTDLVDEEYLRSINNIETSEIVTREEFETDKAEILNKIEELSEIMETKNFKAWLNNIDNESKTYYANPANLRKAQKKLPIKTITLAHIDDYFYYVFIPSRKNSQIDEIRYISKTNIKAVQVKEDLSTVVYYYFNKIDGEWKVHLPEI